MAWVMVAVTSFNAVQGIQAGKYAQGISNLEAQQREYLGRQERETALETARVIRRAGQRQVAQANAAYVGAGVKVGEGSAGLVEQEVAQNVEHDAFQAILEGNRRGRGMDTEAALKRINGGMQRTAGYVGAVGTVLGGAFQGATMAGWRSGGPGFSGTQAPAPVTDLSTYGPGIR